MISDIKKSSWHYRFLVFLGDPIQFEDRVSYWKYWKTVIGSVISVIGVIVVTVCVIMLLIWPYVQLSTTEDALWGFTNILAIYGICVEFCVLGVAAYFWWGFVGADTCKQIYLNSGMYKKYESVKPIINPDVQFID